MGFCSNCGSWVDEGDVCGCCGGAGSYGYESDDDELDLTSGNKSRSSEYSKKAWDLYMDFNDSEALRYIDMALDLDNRSSGCWNIKAIILEGMKRYAESLRCYDRSLELSFDSKVSDNKMRMLYGWAQLLIEESKELSDGLGKLEEAKEKNMDAISSRPGMKSEESLDKYLTQRDTIDFYIGYERKYRRNLEMLKSFDRDELFTIAGRNFYRNGIDLTSGMALRLVKEPENEFDGDAIAVYVGDEKVGYVANKSSTKYELTSSASELQDKFKNACDGEYLFYLERYADIQFHIGRIVK